MSKKTLLSEATDEQIYAELAARELRRAPVRVKWLCQACGNEHIPSRLNETFFQYGELWCRRCVPGWVVLYAAPGKPKSVPMVRVEY